MKGGKFVKRLLTASVWQEGGWFVAQCPEVDVATQGETEEAPWPTFARFWSYILSPPIPTIKPQVRTLEVEIGAS